MAVANLGRVSFVLQGDYDSAKAYTRLDVVNMNGFAYAAISDVPAGNPPPDTTYWQQMSVQGPPGDPGATGASGVEVGNVQPTGDGTNLWINPNAIESISIPEIDDTTTSSEDTWSSQKIAQEIANSGGGGGGGGSSYVLPVATSTVLGGVMPDTKTSDMTQVVGVDSSGKLYTEPGASEYTLPVATSETLGGVKPVAKTEGMTQSVGVDAQGGLWALPGGGSGGGESAFELIDTIDWSTAEMAQVNAYKEYTVDNVKEIIFVYNNMKNNTETASTVNAVFNDNYSAMASCAKTGKTSQALSGYVHFKLFENVGMQQYSSGGAVTATNYSNDGTGAYGYNLLPITQPISKIKVTNPATQYFATGGTTKMYVR